jgi:hypothetical protein
MQLVKPRSWGNSFFFFIVSVFFCAIAIGAAAQQSPSGWQAAAPSSTPQSSTPQSPAAAPTGPAQPSLKPMPNMTAPSLPPGIDPKTMLPLYETIQEDWSSLSIGTSRLEPEPPLVVVQPDEESTFTRMMVRVQWRPGDPIDLWIVLPKGVKKPPAVLYLYGHTEDTDRFHSDRWCEHATMGGVAAVGFVSALTGHRFHDRPLQQWFVSELQESLGSTVHDVKFILDYLAQRGEIDMNRVAMFGEGSGGAIAILAAAADPRIKAVDTLDPWGDWPVFLAQSPVVNLDREPARFVKPDFLKSVAPLDPVKWLPGLKVPIRVQQVRRNVVVPLECKESIKAAAPKQAEIVRFEGKEDFGRKEGQGRLFDWIKEKVLEPAGPGSQNETKRAELGHSAKSVSSAP